ncbi:hypothetical protein NZK35_26900 [Stieleria sp. ICT_E10.1]|nr:hypothetical protein [Stieleria sedimenti]
MQHQAREWWSVERPKFNLVTSQLTIIEASDGDPSAAADRLRMLDGIPLVPLGHDVDALANLILSNQCTAVGESSLFLSSHRSRRRGAVRRSATK